MPLERLRWNGTAWVLFQSASLPEQPVFTPGVTMPYYVPTADFTGAKNVGNLPGTTLTPYGGTLAGNGALVQLAAGTYNNIDFGDRRLDPRGAVTMNNCRVTLTTGNYGTDSINAVVQRLNGGIAGLLIMNDCEIHNRSQRILNALSGRNTEMHRTVITGCVDGISTSTGGSAPQTTGVHLFDCWVGDHAWWYYTASGVVHPSDTQTHNDGMQIGDTLGSSATNTFFGIWPSEYVGTGTPGSGSNDGNAYVASYITTQATMESWRATFLNRLTRADQSFDGIARKTSTGGSWAGILVARSNVTLLHCWFSGGGVHVNASAVETLNPTNLSIKQCTHWNDMSAGHSLTTTAKGAALYVRADRSGYTIPTSGADRNVWFDGTTVTTTTI